MRIGHFQVFTQSGDFEANLSKLVEGMKRADRDRVEVVCFPECFLTGYPHSAEQARQIGITADSPQMMRAVDATARIDVTAVVGFGELRGKDYYNSAVVLHKGHILGIYRKCTAYETWEKQGREFPVFRRGDVTFGVIICSDGGYIEPARILAIKGAKIIFAPHFNYITKEYLLDHYRTVRSDHTARAVENSVYFVRGNNYGRRDPKKDDRGGYKDDRVGYGDSYIVDPHGEIVVRSRQFEEDFIFADINLALAHNSAWKIGRSLWSFHELGKLLADAAG